MLNIKELNIHESSFNNYDGNFTRLNFQNEFRFTDFLEEEKLSDKQFDMLSSFTFNTVVTNNYHHQYINSMMFEINQINYGVKRYDISTFEQLENELNECIEFSGLTKNEKKQIFELFEQAIEEFEKQVYSIEEVIKEKKVDLIEMMG